MVERAAINRVENISVEFLSNSFSRKEGRGKPSTNKSRMFEQFYTLPTFQNGRFALFKIYAGGKQILLKNLLEKFSLLGALRKQLEKC